MISYLPKWSLILVSHLYLLFRFFLFNVTQIHRRRRFAFGRKYDIRAYRFVTLFIA